MKRMVSMVLSLTLVMSFFTFPVSAENNAPAAESREWVGAPVPKLTAALDGDYVTASIKLCDDYIMINSITLNLLYDASLVTVVTDENETTHRGTYFTRTEQGNKYCYYGIDCPSKIGMPTLNQKASLSYDGKGVSGYSIQWGNSDNKVIDPGSAFTIHFKLTEKGKAGGAIELVLATDSAKNYALTMNDIVTLAAPLPEQEIKAAVAVPISRVTLTGDIAPATGEEKSAKTVSTGTDSVTAAIEWTGEFSTLDGKDVFKGSTAYTATITLSPKAGLAFTENPTFDLTGLEGGADLLFAAEEKDGQLTDWAAAKAFGATAAAALSSIKTEGTPTKASYTDGDTFDPAGLTVKAAYTDGTEAAIRQKSGDRDGYEIAYARPTGDYAAKLQKGDTKVTVSYTENGVNKTADVTVTVAGKTVTADRFTVDQGALTYTGADQKNAVIEKAGVVTGGPTRVTYAVKENGGVAKDPGTYTITATVADDDPHYAATQTAVELSGQVTINKKELAVDNTATAENVNVVVGDGDFVEPTYSYEDSALSVNEAVSGNITYSYTGASPVIDGTKTDLTNYLKTLAKDDELEVTWKLTASEDGNFTGTVRGKIKFKLVDMEFKVGTEPATAENAAECKKPNPTYGDSWADIINLKTISVTLNGATVEGGTFSIPGKPAAGTERQYTVKYTTKDGKVYDVFTGTQDIAKAQLSLTWDKLGSTYDGSIIAPNPTLSGYVSNESGLKVSLAYKNGAVDLPSAPKDAGTYAITPTLAAGEAGATAALDNYALSTDAAAAKTWTIDKKPVTVSGITASDKTYDGTTEATVDVNKAVFVGMIGDDELTITAVGAFADKNAGASKTVNLTLGALGGSAAGNYTLAGKGNQATAAATISPKPVTVNGITAANKTWDGTAVATLDTTVAAGKVAIGGLVSGDVVTVTAVGTFQASAPYSASDVAYDRNDEITTKTVAISDITLGGAAAGNYTLADQGRQTETTAMITKASIAPVIADIDDQVYTGSEIIPEVTVTAAINGTLTALKQSQDYTVTATVGKNNDNVNVSASGKTGSVTITAVSKNYDIADAGSAASTKTFHIVPKAIDGTDSGVTIGDVASHPYDRQVYAPTLTVTDSKVQGSDKALAAGADYTVAYTVKATGASVAAPTDAGIYTATITGTGNYTGTLAKDFEITKAQITAITGVKAENKVYDGTANATITLTDASITGNLDGANLIVTGATGEFINAQGAADTTVGNRKMVKVTGLRFSGSAASNYELSSTATINGGAAVTANITAKAVKVVGGITAADKTFDNSTTATVDASNAVFDGVIGDDVLTIIGATGAFADKNAGANKTVNLTLGALGGAAAGNYVLAEEGNQATAAATISKATRTLSLGGQVSSITLYGKDATASVTLVPSADLDGSAAAAITVTVSPENVASWEKNALTYTVKQVVEETGMTTLTFTLPATTNYEAGGSVRLNVTAKAGYDVTVAAAVGGTASAKVGEAMVRTAKANDEVTLAATPAVGCRLSSWTVTKTGEAGTVVTVTDGKFTMPAYSVTVTPTFAKNDYTIGFDTTDAKISAITAKKSGASVTSANYDDEITLAFTTESGAAVNSVTYTRTVKEDGKDVTETVTLTPDATGAYTFKMPAQNITVKVTAVTPLTIKGNDKITKLQTRSTSATENITTAGIQAVPGVTVTVEAAAAGSGETLGAIIYSYIAADDTAKTAAVTKTVTEDGVTTYSFVVPDDVKSDEAITVTAAYNNKAKVAAAVAETGGAVSVAAVFEQGETEAEVAIDVDDTTKQDLQTAASNVTVTIPVQAVPTPDADKRVEALAALAQVGLVTVDTSDTAAETATVDADTIRVVEKTYPEVKVTDFKETATNVTVTMDITLKKREIATAVAAGIQLTAQNSVDLGAPQSVDNVKNTSITVGIPDVLAKKAINNTIYVLHTHGSKDYEYRATITGVTGKYRATFFNPHGFSEFTLSAESSAVASYQLSANDTRYYPSFATAVADAIDAGVTTITMHKMPKAGDIAQIDGTKAGTLTIKATPEAGINFGDLYDLTSVKAPDAIPAPMYGKASTSGEILRGMFRYAPLYSVEISGGSSVQIGRQLALTATVKGINGNVVANAAVVWGSSNTGKGTVSDGTVTGVASGSTNVTATYTADGRSYTGTLAVTVGGGGSGSGGGGGGGSGGSAETVNTAGDVKGGAVTATVFADVPADSFYADAVAWAIADNITTGTTDTTFSPDAFCTRAQAVTFLYRAAGEPAVTADVAFADVEAGSYYEKAVAWAVANGITNGVSAAKFDPHATCTRAQIVTFLSRYEKAEAASGSVFTDVSAGEFYAGAVGWAVANGITNGVSATTFAPNATCTRGQIVTFLYRDFVK